MRIRSERGFSLLQLILALQLTVILAAVGVSKMGLLKGQLALMSGSNQLAFEIARARAQAIAQNRYVHIKMLSATQYVREKSTDASGTTWDTNSAKSRSLPKGLTGTSNSEIKFDTKGIARTNNSVVLKNTANQSKTVSTSFVGKVSVN